MNVYIIITTNWSGVFTINSCDLVSYSASLGSHFLLNNIFNGSVDSSCTRGVFRSSSEAAFVYLILLGSKQSHDTRDTNTFPNVHLCSP